MLWVLVYDFLGTLLCLPVLGRHCFVIQLGRESWDSVLNFWAGRNELSRFGLAVPLFVFILFFITNSIEW